MKLRLGRVVAPGRSFIPQIDGLRFVAISIVFFFHIAHYIPLAGVGSGPPGKLLNLLMVTGRYGVQLFFVISGFVLALPFVRERLAQGRPVSLRAYYLRRVTRLEPPYLLILTGIFLFDIFSPLALRQAAGTSPLEATRNLLPHFLIGAVYQHAAVYGQMNPMLGVAWSLEVEVQFYILTPLFVSLFFLKNRALRRAVTVALIVGFDVIRMVQTDWRYFACVLGHMHEFLAGYLLADLYVVDWKESPREGPGWDLVSALGWVILWPLVRFEHILEPVLPFVVLSLYVAAFRGPHSRRLFRQPLLVVIGGMCYTIYLVHGELIHIFMNAIQPYAPSLPFQLSFIVYSVVLTPVVLGIGTLLFATVERPCMNPAWPSALKSRLRGSSALTPTAVTRPDP